MGLLNYLDQDEYSAALGMDSTSPLMNVQQGFVRSALNSNVGLVSGWIKRNGFSKVNSGGAWGTLSVTLGEEFKKADGTLQAVVFGKNASALSGKLGYIPSGSTAAPTDIIGSLSNTSRPSFAQVSGRLFMYNDADNGILYDGTATTRQIGIDAPTVAPSGSASGVGGLTAGDYLYAQTFYNSLTKAESSPSPISNPITAAAGNTIPLTLQAGSSATADLIRIWRTGANGNQLYLDGTNAIGDTTYTSTIADDELGRPIEFDNSRLSDVTTAKGKFAVVAQTRVFVVTDRNEIRYSALGYEGPMPESFQAKAVVSTNGKWGDADEIVGLGTIGDLVVVIKRRSVGVLQPLDLPLFNSAVDPQGFRFVEISESQGGISHWAGAQVEGEYVFIGRDNVWATDGQRVRPAGIQGPGGLWFCPIQSTIRSLGWSTSQINNVSFCADTKNRRVYIQVFVESDDTVPKYTLVGDYQQYPQFRWTLYTPGTNESTHPGWQAGSFFAITNDQDGSKDIWFGNTANNGRIYKANDGTSDDSKDIYFQITTRPLDLGKPNHLKLYKIFRAQVQGDSSDYSIQMAPLFDLGLSEGVSESVSLHGSGSLFDDPLYVFDDALFEDDSAILAEYDAHRKARNIQMIFRQTAKDAPVTLFGWSPSGSLFQR